MYVLICGGRDFAWDIRHDRYLNELYALYGFVEVLVGSDERDRQGRLRGAEAHALDWARRAGIDRTLMPANWVGHGPSGGPRRNTRMLQYLELVAANAEAQPLVIAFPGGRGTEDCCMQASAFSVPVLRYPALRIEHA